MDKVEMVIMGSLKIIGWFEDNKLVKVTTMDGTELKLKSAGDCAGYYEDQLQELRETDVKTRS